MDNMKNLQAEERRVVTGQLIPEFQKLFFRWNDEYSSQARDLGAIGETVNLWRKAKRVKAAMIDGASTVGWREPLRIILFELICHAFLLLFDLDKQVALDTELQYLNAKEERQKLVPNCGHPNCIEHSRVPLGELSSDALNRYQQCLRVQEGDDGAADTG